MALKKKYLHRLSWGLALLAWVFMLISGLILISDYPYPYTVISDVPDFFPKLFLIAYILLLYAIFHYSIGKSESFNILELLWRVFVTGLVATLFSLISRFILFSASGVMVENNINQLLIIYYINAGLILIFLLAVFHVWKKLILYQKSKKLVITWQIFVYSLLISLFLDLLDLPFFGLLFNIIFAFLIIIGLYLSVNLKWVAYLNYKQKWKSILLNLLITFYLFYFINFLAVFPNVNLFFIDIAGNITILAIFVFVLIYAIFSVLVTLFNLPTSSVFEQKLEEVVSFQRLSRSKDMGGKEENVYAILLESSVSAVIANAAWLQLFDKDGNEMYTLYHRITEHGKHQIEKKIDPKFIEHLLNAKEVKDHPLKRFVINIDDAEYKSILFFPLFVQDTLTAKLILLKDISDGFNREMIEIIRTFVNQASISIENQRLLQEAIENERYKEELEIAKRVQGSLLPDILHKNDDFDIITYTRSAAEVGGDYYDTYRIDQNKVAIIIGDVSGKGTSAAFHMSEMKGIFHSLVQLDMSPKEFIMRANHALGNCLDRTSFITVSYFIFDRAKKTINFTRAGHCPTLIYDAKKRHVEFLEDHGLGLGILRDDQFANYIEVNTRSYLPGDILLLYTDGITEAKNENNEEFGYERLRELVKANYDQSPEEIERVILNELTTFCGTKPPSDDLTLLVIKFK